MNSASIIKYLKKKGVAQETIDLAQNKFQLKAMRSFVKICEDINIPYKAEGIDSIKTIGDYRIYNKELRLDHERDFLEALGVERKKLDQITNYWTLKLISECKRDDPDIVINLEAVQTINSKKKLKAFLDKLHSSKFNDSLRNLGASEDEINETKDSNIHVKKAHVLARICDPNNAPDLMVVKTVDNESLLEAFILSKRCMIPLDDVKKYIKNNEMNFVAFREFLFGITNEQIETLIANNPNIAGQLTQLFQHMTSNYSDATSTSLILNISNFEEIAHFITQKLASNLGFPAADFEHDKFLYEIVKIIGERDEVDIIELLKIDLLNITDLLNLGDTVANFAKNNDIAMNEREMQLFLNPFLEKCMTEKLDEKPTSEEFYLALKDHVFIVVEEEGPLELV